MEQRCRISGKNFQITQSDLEFYKKMGVNPPTLCPEERSLRRMAFSVQRHLYHRTCDGSGKRIISKYPPESPVPVYDIEYWYSDNWDKYAVGRDYNFNRPFFSQFQDLMQVAPRPNLQRSPQYDENSDYTNYAGKNKNCYLIFDSDKNRDCMYSYSLNMCEDVVDSFRLGQSELCYECLDSFSCYNSMYLQNCSGCSDSSFLKNCIGCKNCFGCVNLKNKEYYFLNEKCSKSEYEEKLAALNLHSYHHLKNMRAHFAEFCLQFPERYMQGVQNEDVVGDYLTNCKNAEYCFDSRNLWDCKYITQAFDDVKTSMDCTEVGDGVEMFYECCYMGYNAQFCRFSTHGLGQMSDLTYCYFCPSTSNMFGCVGMHHAEYCILNKKYSKDEYEALVPKIIEHMKSTGEWGEFFPAELSPFPYNKTHAMDYFPLTKEEALSRGYTWKDDEPRDFMPATCKLPDTIDNVGDEICSEILACENTGRNYKIQKQELKFYRKMNLPLPRLCPDERHMARVNLRNPRELYQRKCAESGEEIWTTIAPERPVKVVCERVFAEMMS